MGGAGRTLLTQETASAKAARWDPKTGKRPKFTGEGNNEMKSES